MPSGDPVKMPYSPPPYKEELSQLCFAIYGVSELDTTAIELAICQLRERIDLEGISEEEGAFIETVAECLTSKGKLNADMIAHFNKLRLEREALNLLQAALHLFKKPKQFSETLVKVILLSIVEKNASNQRAQLNGDNSQSVTAVLVAHEDDPAQAVEAITDLYVSTVPNERNEELGEATENLKTISESLGAAVATLREFAGNDESPYHGMAKLLLAHAIIKRVTAVRPSDYLDTTSVPLHIKEQVEKLFQEIISKEPDNLMVQSLKSNIPAELLEIYAPESSLKDPYKLSIKDTIYKLIEDCLTDNDLAHYIPFASTQLKDYSANLKFHESFLFWLFIEKLKPLIAEAKNISVYDPKKPIIDRLLELTNMYSKYSSTKDLINSIRRLKRFASQVNNHETVSLDELVRADLEELIASRTFPAWLINGISSIATPILIISGVAVLFIGYSMLLLLSLGPPWPLPERPDDYFDYDDTDHQFTKAAWITMAPLVFVPVNVLTGFGAGLVLKAFEVLFQTNLRLLTPISTTTFSLGQLILYNSINSLRWLGRAIDIVSVPLASFLIVNYMNWAIYQTSPFSYTYSSLDECKEAHDGCLKGWNNEYTDYDCVDSCVDSIFSETNSAAHEAIPAFIRAFTLAPLTGAATAWVCLMTLRYTISLLSHLNSPDRPTIRESIRNFLWEKPQENILTELTTDEEQQSDTTTSRLYTKLPQN